jgi:hypothetical protein
MPYISKNIKEFEMYKKYLTLLLLLLSLSFISLKGTSLPIFAFEEVNTPSPYVKRIVPMETKSLPGGVELRSQGVRTQNNGDPQGSWLDRDVHSLVAPGSNTAVRVVSWGLSAANGFSAGTMVEIAQDYQIKHPGTIVIGGISGDFFNNQTPDGNTKEPLNNWVSEGDVIKKDVLEPDFHNVLGFKEDRSWVEGKPTSTENLQLKILNEGDVTDVYDIANIIGTSGDTLNPNGINIVYPGFDGNLDTTGYTIVKGNYETFKQSRTGLQGKIYIENDNLGSFLKGEIKEIIPGGEAISKVPLGTFYILSKDESIQTILPVNTKIKCEYTLTGEFAGVDNTVGYIFKILEDGNSNFQQYNGSHSYIYLPRARAAIGFKPDKSVVLLTAGLGSITGSNQAGPSLFELAELLKLEGCTEGFNLDGGGSASIVARTETGGLEMLNTPSDGSPRAIGNGILFVMQDPNIRVTETTSKSITVEQTAPIKNGTLTQADVVLAGKRYSLLDGPVILTDLNKNSRYNLKYEFTYEHKGQAYYGEINETVYTDSVDAPDIRRFKVSNVTETSVDIEYQIRGDNLDEYYINYQGQNHYLDDKEGTVTLTGFTKDDTVEFILYVYYSTQPGITKRVESEPLSVTFKAKTGGGGGCQMGTNIYYFIGLFALGLFIYKRRR